MVAWPSRLSTILIAGLPLSAGSRRLNPLRRSEGSVQSGAESIRPIKVPGAAASGGVTLEASPLRGMRRRRAERLTKVSSWDLTLVSGKPTRHGLVRSLLGLQKGPAAGPFQDFRFEWSASVRSAGQHEPVVIRRARTLSLNWAAASPTSGCARATAAHRGQATQRSQFARRPGPMTRLTLMY